MSAASAWHRYGERLRKLVSFFAVGGLAAATYIIACTLLVQWFPLYKAAISIGVHCALIPIVFLAQRHITFRSDGHWLREFAQYAGLQLCSISLSTLALVRFVTGHPFMDLMAFLAIAGGASIITFAVCNSVIFRNSPLGRSAQKP